MGKGSVVRRVIGIDQGDRWSHLCIVDAAGEVIGRERVRTTREGYEKRFAREAVKGRIVLEVGPHSPWSSRLLEGLGYEVVVANARRVKLIAKAERKTDRVDAETLARLGRVDPALLAPIRHGGEAAQRDTALLRVREGLVRSRTRLIQLFTGSETTAGGEALAGESPFRAVIGPSPGPHSRRAAPHRHRQAPCRSARLARSVQWDPLTEKEEP